MGRCIIFPFFHSWTKYDIFNKINNRMKKFVFDTTRSYNGISTKDSMIQIWENNFLHESSKFISATYLQPEDLGRLFKDLEGAVWKILGQTNGREIPCENQETLEIITFDRWFVSEVLHPEKHAKDFSAKSELTKIKKPRKNAKTQK